jgi:hypothetical protein
MIAVLLNFANRCSLPAAALANKWQAGLILGPPSADTASNQIFIRPTAGSGRTVRQVTEKQAVFQSLQDNAGAQVHEYVVQGFREYRRVKQDNAPGK